MLSLFNRAVWLCTLGLLLPSTLLANECPLANGVAVQVLGSGGPIADDGRASTAYLLWVDGKSRVLIDAGGGAFLRFAEAAADFAALDFIGLSHFHADHSADLAALLKSGSFKDRPTPLIVAGPDGRKPFPGLDQFLMRLLGPDSGAYAYLGAYFGGASQRLDISTIEVSSADPGPQAVLGSNDSAVQVEAMHVPHGVVPALAYRVRAGDKVVVFASDQNASKRSFMDFARDADLLVMHMPVPEDVQGIGRQLHAPPSAIGATADGADVKALLISHLMMRSLRDLEQNIERVRSRFDGSIEVAQDLGCYPLNGSVD